MTTPILLPITCTTTVVLLSLYYLFPLALGTESLPHTYIMDTDGEPMLNGATYYILPARTTGGGLTTVPPNTSSPCPLYITQESDPTSNGLPIKISSNISSKYLPFGTTIFSFPIDTVTPCKQPLVWRPTPDNTTGNQYVVAGTAHQHTAAAPSGFSIIFTLFSSRMRYHIIYCYESKCGFVGFLRENGLLGVNAVNSFQFKKAFTGIPTLDLPL